MAGSSGLMPRRLLHRVGRRGCSLAFLALLDVLFAQALWTQPPEVRAAPANQFLGSLLPLHWWGAVWLTVGSVCLVQAFMRVDRVAFAASTALKLTWGSLNLAGWMVGEVPRGWVSATFWLAFGGFVTIIATWPELHEMIRRTGESREGLVGADSAGRIVSWNAAAASLFGWKASEIIGEPLTTLIPEELRERHRAGFERAVRNRRSDLVGRVLPLTGVRKDGSRVPVELTITVWESPAGEVSFTGLVRDVSAGGVSVKGGGR